MCLARPITTFATWAFHLMNSLRFLFWISCSTWIFILKQSSIVWPLTLHNSQYLDILSMIDTFILASLISLYVLPSRTNFVWSRDGHEVFEVKWFSRGHVTACYFFPFIYPIISAIVTTSPIIFIPICVPYVLDFSFLFYSRFEILFSYQVLLVSVKQVNNWVDVLPYDIVIEPYFG